MLLLGSNCLRVIAVIQFFSITTFISAWPEPDEKLQWSLHRSLVEYKMYASVNYDKIDIPPNAAKVNISMTSDMSQDDCQIADVTLYASMYGFPVVQRDDEEFPNNTYSPASPVYNTTVSSNNKSVHWILDGSLLPGPLMLMAVLPKPDSRIRQQGLGYSCSYYLTTVASVSYYQEEDITPLDTEKTNVVTVDGSFQQIYSFPVPLDAASYKVEITGCDAVGGNCPVNITLMETLTSDLDNPSSGVACEWDGADCVLQVSSPYVRFMNYLVISSSVEANFTLDVIINSTVCGAAPVNDSVETAGSCVSSGSLGRETPASASSGSNFFDRFVSWDAQRNPSAVITEKVLDTYFTVHSFNLRPTDTGGSLRVEIGIPPSAQVNQQSFTVDLCLSVHRVDPPSHCTHGELLHLTSQESKEVELYTLVPYPPSGRWHITLQSSCYQKENDTSNSTMVPCEHPIVANLTVALVPCVDGGCNQRGSCNLYIGAGMLYSACDCYSGWKGYGCNDGSDAESASLEKLAVYLLTLSNLAFIPGICISLYRRLWVEAFVYAFNMFFSTFYHACDTSRIYQLCIVKYDTLSFADFFASLMSFWVTLMAMARLPAWLRTLLQVAGAVFIAVGEVHNRHGLWEQMLPLILGIFILLLSWGIECHQRRQLFPHKRRLLLFVLPGIGLAVIGLVLNLALETEENYKYVHSCWHVLEASAICFLLPPHNSSTRLHMKSSQGSLSIQSGDIRRMATGNRSSNTAVVGANGEEADLLDIRLNRADDVGSGEADTGSRHSASPTENQGSAVYNGIRLSQRNLVL